MSSRTARSREAPGSRSLCAGSGEPLEAREVGAGDVGGGAPSCGDGERQLSSAPGQSLGQRRGRCVAGGRAGTCPPALWATKSGCVSPLPSTGHVHRSEAAAASGGPGEYIPAVFLFHLRAQEPPPLSPPLGLLMSRCRPGIAGAGASLLHDSGFVRSPQAGPLRFPLPVHLHTRCSTRPRAVPAPPASQEAHPADVARPRHRPSSPHSRGSALTCACAPPSTRLS